MADAGSIGVRIARRRQVLGMRQEDLAARLGVAKSTVAKWETGVHFPKRKLGAVEAVLGISLSGEPDAPVSPVPAEILALIRRRFPEDRQQEAIEALEDILAPPTEPGEGDRTDPSDPSRPSRRAS